MLYGQTYINAGGIYVVMLRTQTTRDRLQNNPMIVIYYKNRETTFLNTLATILSKNNLTHKLQCF